MGAGAGVVGAGRFVFSALGNVSFRTLVAVTAAGVVAGDCGVEGGVVACGGVAGMPAGGEACLIAFSNWVAVRR